MIWVHVIRLCVFLGKKLTIAAKCSISWGRPFLAICPAPPPDSGMGEATTKGVLLGLIKNISQHSSACTWALGTTEGVREIEALRPLDHAAAVDALYVNPKAECKCCCDGVRRGQVTNHLPYALRQKIEQMGGWRTRAVEVRQRRNIPKTSFLFIPWRKQKHIRCASFCGGD